MNAGSVPYNYGDLVAITSDAARTYFWFSNREGIIRGIPLDTADPNGKLGLGELEIVVKRGGGVETSSRTSLHG